MIFEEGVNGSPNGAFSLSVDDTDFVNALLKAGTDVFLHHRGRILR